MKINLLKWNFMFGELRMEFIRGKKAYFFSLDALVALIIIIGIVILIKPYSSQKTPEAHIQEDLITVLSSLKIGEINNSYVKELISENKITDINQSVLEQIGEFYAKSDPEAQFLAQSVINQLNISENIGLYFNNQPITEKYSIPQNNATDIWTSRQIISGIQQGSSVKGYSSRAFLTAANKVKYFYFGGYIGDGNISAKIDYTGKINSAEMELAINNNFSIYVNGHNVADYTASDSVISPKKYTIPIAYFQSNLTNGNIIELVGKNLYIAGGYIKITYESSEINGKGKKYLPGIKGLINLYDSFYVPGQLENMKIFLHYKSNYKVFLTIGNKTIYTGQSNNSEFLISLNNSYLSSIFDYSQLSRKTIPLRLGLENASYVFNKSMDVDVFSVTDISGSMADVCLGASGRCCHSGCDSNQSLCIQCGGTWQNKITMAKEADYIFIDSVLNNSRNRVGLVAYNTTAIDQNYHALSNNNVSLKAKVSTWNAGGTTCICCGINKAVQKLLNESDASKFRSIVLMSDGLANVQCSQQGTQSAIQDAIKSACDAYNNYKIKIYSVGFGSDADEATLQSIAACGHGSYYYGDVSNIVEIYRQIAEEIKAAAYLEQTVIGENINSTLYPDSYIETDYQSILPYGLIINSETSEFGNQISQGSLYVPNDTQPYEVKVISYSGSQWTDKVEVFNQSSGKWESIFNLSEYSIEYIYLGDPYVINIPVQKIILGNNSIKVSTALNSFNSTGGSSHNKIIYSLIKEISSYSPILANAEGCIWEIEFEDSTNLTIKVPLNYSGSEKCYYNHENIAYNPNDAIDSAVYSLLLKMDLNKNRLIETKFLAEDIQISSNEIQGIPFTWDTEVQVRIWR